ncbi:MAG: helix-turn-helix domain-containing protein [Oscillospiraceae bacterium]|nr:helix-turn-helix domain-containing protein [Oscillospiraceae bacterium]
MAIKYKIDVLPELKKAGFSANRLRTEKIIGNSTIDNFRHGIVCYGKSLEILCKLLNCQPGDILEYVPDDDQAEPEEN